MRSHPSERSLERVEDGLGNTESDYDGLTDY